MYKKGPSYNLVLTRAYYLEIKKFGSKSNLIIKYGQKADLGELLVENNQLDEIYNIGFILTIFSYFRF